MANKQLKEELAKVAHEAWAGFVNYMLGLCDHNEDGSATVPKQFITRWKRQMRTPYDNLPEAEKKSDRNVADRYIIFLKSLKPKQPKDKPDSRVNEVKAIYTEYCQNIRNFTPVFNHGLDGKKIKEKLKGGFEIEDFKELFDWFLCNKEYIKTFSPSISTALSAGVVNKFLAQR